jgi:hypothetical protein
LASASEWASKLEEIQSIGPQARKRIASKAKAAALDTFSPAAASSLLNKLFSQES